MLVRRGAAQKVYCGSVVHSFRPVDRMHSGSRGGLDTRHTGLCASTGRQDLTARGRWRKSCAMPVLRWPGGVTEIRRLAALVALVAVFFLPLHFHSLTKSAKVATECACAQGTRTVASLAPAPPTVIAVLEIQPLLFTAGAKYQRLSVSLSSIRAPPVLAVI
jgi:hypothetical protein